MSREKSSDQKFFLFPLRELGFGYRDSLDLWKKTYVDGCPLTFRCRHIVGIQTSESLSERKLKFQSIIERKKHINRREVDFWADMPNIKGSEGLFFLYFSRHFSMVSPNN